jgi:hypothetical protein
LRQERGKYRRAVADATTSAPELSARPRCGAPPPPSSAPRWPSAPGAALRDDSLEGMQASDRLFLASDLLDIVAALLAIAVAVKTTLRLSRPAPAAAPPA